MNNITCQLCKSAPSTSHITKEVNGVAHEIYLCGSCFQKNAMREKSGNPLQSMLEVLDQFLEPNNDGPSRSERTRKNMHARGTSELDKYCVDLTQSARNGHIDPIIGRDIEIDRLINILNRRTKNNPVLIGEPGVGKTAIAEGLALRIAEGKVPAKMAHKRILSLDITAVTAGTMYRGMFEERMKKIARDAEKNQDVILFIDEMHVIMGAGGTMDNNMDAANILKPYLTKGRMQVIGATTLEEYREIEKDAALERRFQTITIDEPTVEETYAILKGLRSNYESFHGVRYTDEVLHACVQIADRYIFERFMPDKAIDLMDELGARLNLRNTGSNESTQQRINELFVASQEAAREGRFPEAMRLKEERLLLEAQAGGSHTPLHTPTVEQIKQIAEEITGIPVTDLNDSDKEKLLLLQTRLSDSVIGQPEAIGQVVRAVKRNRINLRQKKKPTVFLFTGPTGVGKTELTKRLAVELFGDEKSMLRFDMSEYMESHSVSKLIGSPPGYIGHEKSGKLTEQVRRRPYSVILLDEFEKAHGDVQNLLLQVFDDGRLTDAQGKTVDFSHTIIVMTSNLGATAPKMTGFRAEKVEAHFLNAIHGHFRPEFINRIDSIIPFSYLTKASILSIVENMMEAIHTGLNERGVTLELADGVADWLAEKGFDEKFGARPLYRAITTHIEDLVTDHLLEHEDISFIRVEIDAETSKPSIAQTDFA